MDDEESAGVENVQAECFNKLQHFLPPYLTSVWIIQVMFVACYLYAVNFYIFNISSETQRPKKIKLAKNVNIAYTVAFIKNSLTAITHHFSNYIEIWHICCWKWGLICHFNFPHLQCYSLCHDSEIMHIIS